MCIQIDEIKSPRLPLVHDCLDRKLIKDVCFFEITARTSSSRAHVMCIDPKNIHSFLSEVSSIGECIESLVFGSRIRNGVFVSCGTL